MSEKFNRDEIIEKIKNISLFNSINDDLENLNHIVDALELKSVDKNEEIIVEGTQGKEMYILLKGEIEIAKYTMGHERFTVAKLNDQMNVFFGELALVDTDKRSASVRALSQCDLLVLERDQFLKLGKDYPAIGWSLGMEIASILSSRLRKANEDTIVLFETLVHELSA